MCGCIIQPSLTAGGSKWRPCPGTSLGVEQSLDEHPCTVPCAVQTPSGEHREPFLQLVQPDGWAFTVFFPWCGAQSALGAVGRQLSCDPWALHGPFFLRGRAGDCCYSWCQFLELSPDLAVVLGSPHSPRHGEGLAAVPGWWGCELSLHLPMAGGALPAQSTAHSAPRS